MWRMRASILQAFRGAFHKGERGGEAAAERTCPRAACCSAIAALSVPIAGHLLALQPSVIGAVVAAAVMMVTGFLLSAVGGYLVGLVGGSNQPVSGLALSALILSALLMVASASRACGRCARCSAWPRSSAARCASRAA